MGGKSLFVAKGKLKDNLVTCSGILHLCHHFRSHQSLSPSLFSAASTLMHAKEDVVDGF